MSLACCVHRRANVCPSMCSIAVSLGNKSKVTPKRDRPSLLVEVSKKATLECCFDEKDVNPIWISNAGAKNATNPERRVKETNEVKQRKGKAGCHTLEISNVKLTDTGFYQCFVNFSSIYSHGTFLQVYSE